MKMVMMTVRYIDVVDRFTPDAVDSWLRINPPLRAKAWSLPSRIGEYPQPTGFDRDRCMTDKRDFHYTASANNEFNEL